MKACADKKRILSQAVCTVSSIQGEWSPRLVGNSACMQRLRALIDVVKNRSCTVLIHGESGTGKELLAQSIHASSPRAAGPFIPTDCATLRDTLFESQLFGHVKGAFTGAERPTRGFFRAADGGTLFLDEIGELDPQVQAKLLRCIQEGAVVPLGAVEPIPVNVRIIAATNRDLKEMVRQGAFREDLYYRLNVVCLEVPPLRERRNDIVELAEYFLEWQAQLYNEPCKELDSESKEYLTQYAWPGNVRELANVMEYAHIMSPGRTIAPLALPLDVLPTVVTGRLAPFPTLAQVKKKLIMQALQYTHGRKMAAADLLGVERRRLNRLIRHLGIEPLIDKSS